MSNITKEEPGTALAELASNKQMVSQRDIIQSQTNQYHGPLITQPKDCTFNFASPQIAQPAGGSNENTQDNFLQQIGQSVLKEARELKKGIDDLDKKTDKQTDLIKKVYERQADYDGRNEIILEQNKNQLDQLTQILKGQKNVEENVGSILNNQREAKEESNINAVKSSAIFREVRSIKEHVTDIKETNKKIGDEMKAKVEGMQEQNEASAKIQAESNREHTEAISALTHAFKSMNPSKDTLKNQILKKNFDFLKEYVNPDRLLPRMVSDNAISMYDMKSIRNKGIQDDQVAALLFILDRNPNGVDNLIKALRDTDQSIVADQLKHDD